MSFFLQLKLHVQHLEIIHTVNVCNTCIQLQTEDINLLGHKDLNLLSCKTSMKDTIVISSGALIVTIGSQFFITLYKMQLLVCFSVIGFRVTSSSIHGSTAYSHFT